MMKQNGDIDRMKWYQLCTELEQAEMYHLGRAHISSNLLLSDLLRALRKVTRLLASIEDLIKESPPSVKGEQNAMISSDII